MVSGRGRRKGRGSQSQSQGQWEAGRARWEYLREREGGGDCYRGGHPTSWSSQRACWSQGWMVGQGLVSEKGRVRRRRAARPREHPQRG